MVLPPLAERMRPERLEDLVGQEELVGPQGLLRRFWEGGALPSLLFWGPHRAQAKPVWLECWRCIPKDGSTS